MRVFVGFQAQLFYWIKKNSHRKWGSIFWSHLKLEVDVPAGGTIGGSTSRAGARGQRVPSVRVCNLEFFLRYRYVFILLLCFVYICLSKFSCLHLLVYIFLFTFACLQCLHCQEQLTCESPPASYRTSDVADRWFTVEPASLVQHHL